MAAPRQHYHQRKHARAHHGGPGIGRTATARSVHRQRDGCRHCHRGHHNLHVRCRRQCERGGRNVAIGANAAATLGIWRQRSMAGPAPVLPMPPARAPTAALPQCLIPLQQHRADLDRKRRRRHSVASTTTGTGKMPSYRRHVQRGAAGGGLVNRSGRTGRTDHHQRGDCIRGLHSWRSRCNVEQLQAASNVITDQVQNLTSAETT